MRFVYSLRSMTAAVLAAALLAAAAGPVRAETPLTPVRPIAAAKPKPQPVRPAAPASQPPDRQASDTIEPPALKKPTSGWNAPVATASISPPAPPPARASALSKRPWVNPAPANERHAFLRRRRTSRRHRRFYRPRYYAGGYVQYVAPGSGWDGHGP